MSVLYSPTTLAEVNECRALAACGLLVPVGDHFAPWDMTLTQAARARVIGFIALGQVVSFETALWIHTGVWTWALGKRAPTAVRAGSQGSTAGRVVETVRIEGLEVTSLEQTAFDLLRKDYITGVGYLFALMRYGARFQTVRGMLHRHMGVPHTRLARDVLDQLTPEVIEHVLASAIRPGASEQESAPREFACARPSLLR